MTISFFKKRSEKNKQNIDNHLSGIIEEYRQNKTDSNLIAIIKNLSNKELFLSHLSTGYENTYQLLVDLISLNDAINTEIMPELAWKEKSKKIESVSHEFKHHMDDLLVRIEYGGEKLKGICKVCKNWHDFNEPGYRNQVTKLELFKMPL